MNWMKVFWWGLGIAIVLRLVCFFGFAFYNPDGFYVNDSHEYIQIAENILSGNGFSRSPEEPYLPESFRTPGYPGFLALVKTLTSSYYPALVVQIFASALTAYFLLLIARLINREREGVIASIVFLFMPFSILVSFQFLTQTLFTTLITGAVFAFLYFLEKKQWWSLVASAILLPLAAYIRPIGGYLYILFVVILSVATLRHTVSWKQAFVGAAICIIAFFGILAPWVARNETEFGRAELSSITPPFLYFYEAPAVLKSSLGISFEEARKILIEKIEKKTGISSEDIAYTNFSSITDIVQHEAIVSILSDPKAFILTRFELTFSFFTRDGIRYVFEAMHAPENYLDVNAFRIAMIAERAVLLLFLLGFIYCTVTALWKWRTTPLAYFLLVAIALYFAGLTGSMASAGLRYPAEPFYLLIGIVGILQMHKVASIQLVKQPE